jgi:tetratricopeptide (TPR) repeat protein
MRALSPVALTIFCACLIAFAPSCSFIRTSTGPAGNGKKASGATGKQAQKPVDDAGKQAQKAVDNTVIQAQVDIAGGEYKKALELYFSVYEKKHTPDMRDNYSATGEQIRKTADAAFQRKDFAEAGSIYNTLIESGIVTRDFADSLSFNEDYLNGQKNACSKALLEAGLTTYRDGKLEDAIAIWKRAQVFDRDNKDIKNAIDTATTQLQNLKNIKQKNSLTP